MKDLAVRLAALDADAGAALQVIAYFDRLVEARAGLPSIVRGAAVLAGCPARLDDDERRVRVRMMPSGEAASNPGPPRPEWPHISVGSATLWLERAGEAGPVDAMVLERAGGAAGAVLERTLGRVPAADPASFELIVDAAASPEVRVQAARRLGLAEPAYAMVTAAGTTHVLAATDPPAPGRAGIGPAGPILDLPASHAAAHLALRFTAAGTDEDPGPLVVHHADLGGLALLAEHAGEPIPDVRALEHAAAAAPWMLSTLYAVSATSSLRGAAAMLRVHHSTLQDRIIHAEHLLTWNVREPTGRLRLQLALALRRLTKNW
ncbi:helix-turn-helix domain-containing protein [Actinoplanes sp. NPDC051633]|uniref:helix-turn-helix domain-containing protein n=1 Tax=Actinoplanes sp. NPDC051633 TaxID=3155670 RepID=UPI003425AC62